MANLITSLENYKALMGYLLMDFRGKCFNGDWQAQWTVIQRKLCKKVYGFWDRRATQDCKWADQTDLKARCLRTVWKTSCIAFEEVI